MIKTLLYTGVRVWALVRIGTTDVDFESCPIRFNQGKGAQDRYIAFPAAFKEMLALHIDAQTGWRQTPVRVLLTEALQRPRGRKILARYATAAGITGPTSPHRLRRFLFTWLETQGIDGALI